MSRPERSETRRRRKRRGVGQPRGRRIPRPRPTSRNGMNRDVDVSRGNPLRSTRWKTPGSAGAPPIRWSRAHRLRAPPDSARRRRRRRETAGSPQLSQHPLRAGLSVGRAAPERMIVKSTTSGRGTSPIRVLIADDDAAACRALNDRLSREGYEVEQTRNADAALRGCRSSARLRESRGCGSATRPSDRLAHVIVGSGLQTKHPVRFGVPSARDQDRHIAYFTHGAARVQTRDAGDVYFEENEIKVIRAHASGTAVRRVGDIVIDPVRHRVLVAGESVELT